MKRTSLTHEFVDSFPVTLQEGTVYISMKYRSAAHLCACGCRNKVVTPIRPARWHLYFNGDAISLWPSIGNWQFPCQSHYWIDLNQIRWSAPWTPEQISAGRARDVADLERYYARRGMGEAVPAERRRRVRGASFRRIWRRLTGRH